MQTVPIPAAPAAPAPNPSAGHPSARPDTDPTAVTEGPSRTGTVKWFNDQKGFGFILGDGPDGRDVFVHHSVIEGQGFKTLNDGEQVEYAVETGPKGSRAVRVRRSESATDDGASRRPREAVH